MIVFDIRCSSAQVFEAWFGSTEDWEDQRRHKLVSCPVCGSGEVEKAVMAPAVAAKGNRRPDAGAAPVPMSGGEDPEQSKKMLAALAKAQGAFLKNADYVGSRFADEARAMHLDRKSTRLNYSH